MSSDWHTFIQTLLDFPVQMCSTLELLVASDNSECCRKHLYHQSCNRGGIVKCSCIWPPLLTPFFRQKSETSHTTDTRELVSSFSISMFNLRVSSLSWVYVQHCSLSLHFTWSNTCFIYTDLFKIYLTGEVREEMSFTNSLNISCASIICPMLFSVLRIKWHT